MDLKLTERLSLNGACVEALDALSDRLGYSRLVIDLWHGVVQDATHEQPSEFQGRWIVRGRKQRCSNDPDLVALVYNDSNPSPLGLYRIDPSPFV